MGRWMGAQVAGADGGVYGRMAEWVPASSLPHWRKQMCTCRACSKSLVRDTMDITKKKGGSSTKKNGLQEIRGVPWEEAKHEKGESPAPSRLP